MTILPLYQRFVFIAICYCLFSDYLKKKSSVAYIPSHVWSIKASGQLAWLGQLTIRDFHKCMEKCVRALGEGLCFCCGTTSMFSHVVYNFAFVLTLNSASVLARDENLRPSAWIHPGVGMQTSKWTAIY